MPIKRWEPFQEIERWEPLSREPMWALDQMQWQMNRLMEGFMPSGNGGSALNYMRSEFHYGRFDRKIPLPVHVQNDKAQAEYKNGILTLNLPKIEGEKHKAVKIDVK